MLRRFVIAACFTVLAVLGVTSVAQSAGASTPGCTKGAFARYCATQTDQETTPMSWDVQRQAKRVNAPLIAYPDSDTDRALDFVALHPGTSSDGAAKMFIYAPGGLISNLCVSEPSQGTALELRWCNGSAWQVFTAKAVDGTSAFEWVNSATGDVVSADGIRSPLTGIKAQSDPGPGVEWTFAA